MLNRIYDIQLLLEYHATRRISRKMIITRETSSKEIHAFNNIITLTSETIPVKRFAPVEFSSKAKKYITVKYFSSEIEANFQCL
jgi:hypothetical protein